MSGEYYRFIFVASMIVTASIRYGYAWRHRTRYLTPSTNQEGKRNLLMGIQAIVLGSIFIPQVFGVKIMPLNLSPLADNILRSCGLVLGVMAAIGTLWPQFVRQNTWSSPITSPDRIAEHRLVTWGPYTYIRHPFYAAVLLAVVAFELTVASALALILPPVLLLIAPFGIRQEERQLEAVYGDQFRAYKARSWCLIPLIY